MSKEKAAYIIRTSELCTEKFTEQDYNRLDTVIQSLYKMFERLDIKNEHDARFVIESCLNLENESTESKYYYWFSRGFNFYIEKAPGHTYSIHTPHSRSKFTQDDIKFIYTASESLLDSDQFEEQDDIDVFVLDIDVIKRRVPIVAYYKDEPYVTR